MLALYKGASPPLFGWALMDSVHMGRCLYRFVTGSLNYFRHIIQNSMAKEIGIRENALAGLGAGMVVSTVATPIEVIKCRLQIQRKSCLN